MSTIATKYFNTFGAALSYVMSRKGLSQSEFASLVGVDKSQVSRWCNKQAAPHKKTLGTIANAIGYDFLVSDNGLWHVAPSVQIPTSVSEPRSEYEKKSHPKPSSEPTVDDVLLLLQQIEAASRIAQDSLSRLLKKDLD